MKKLHACLELLNRVHLINNKPRTQVHTNNSMFSINYCLNQQMLFFRTAFGWHKEQGFSKMTNQTHQYKPALFLPLFLPFHSKIEWLIRTNSPKHFSVSVCLLFVFWSNLFWKGCTHTVFQEKPDRGNQVTVCIVHCLLTTWMLTMC